MGDYAPINGLLSTIEVEIKVMETDVAEWSASASCSAGSG
jgi:hypothetical protein